MNKVLMISLMVFLISCKTEVKKAAPEQMPVLQVSENGRFFTDQNKKPFFWLGDTGWLLLTKLDREEAVRYLEDRALKGFNVIQMMVLHSVGAVNQYGDSALTGQDVARPLVTEGNWFENPEEYDYWDHLDFVIDQAAEKGLYMALVPVWGSNVKEGHVNRMQGKAYAEFLANRYKDKSNLIWLNGGDVPGSDSTAVWNAIGSTLNDRDPNHLITFHPRGRTQSSKWFHQESWLDFNMFQSGHRRYDQDDSELAYGEDNWRYVEADYRLDPVKPTLDGEPSYEGIPQGLHDTLQPLWNDADVRRYAYWSVFAGAAGFTYGHSSVMQFRGPNDQEGAYGAKKYWTEAINDPGAGQMVHLKKLMLSRPYFDRVPDQSLIASQPGDQYDYLIATRGKGYAFVYTYNGQNINVDMEKINGEKAEASWFNPRNGEFEKIGEFLNLFEKEFDPPGEVQNGNDWVLVLDTKSVVR
jgi:hypothetical protein